MTILAFGLRREAIPVPNTWKIIHSPRSACPSTTIPAYFPGENNNQSPNFEMAKNPLPVLSFSKLLFKDFLTKESKKNLAALIACFKKFRYNCCTTKKTFAKNFKKPKAKQLSRSVDKEHNKKCSKLNHNIKNNSLKISNSSTTIENLGHFLAYLSTKN